MKKLIIIIGLFINITANSQSLKDYSIGQKFSKGYALEEINYNIINTDYSTSVGNLRNVELKAIANKDSIVYKIGFYEANCDDENMARDFRLSVQKNYSIQFGASKSKTEKFNNAFTNYQNLTVTSYERISKIGDITYLLITTKKTMPNPLDIKKNIIFWQITFFITNTVLEKQQNQYSLDQDKLKKANDDNNF